ncbi:MAG TPA: DNA polymerase III subunit delta [Gemmataceae bacterium]|jgi:DNA polymerase-3 subunit delta
MDALAFLDKAAKAKPQPVYVLAGDEPFLKRQVLAALDAALLGDADPDFARTVHPGPTADWSAVRADLDTLPFLSPRRVVVIDQADPFVTKYRPALEKYVGQPAKTGVLILDVKAWPANTKLAKLVPEAATIVCKPPRPQDVVRWATDWAKTRHGKKLDADAAGWLVELVGPEMGLLDQEIAKLAAYAGDRPAISREDVDRLVGRSRAAEAFKIFDAIGLGQPAEALAILGRLLDQGEEPLGLLGAFSWQLRRLARAARLHRAGRPLPAAIDAAGFQPWARDRVERQLRHLGRRRLDRVYDWLLEADLALKSTGALPERVVLERLVVRLARPRAG